MSRRFRSLELDAPAAAAPPSGPTNVCRRCGAEHAEGVAACTRCGGVLGGAGQEDFDAANRARRELLEQQAVRARVDGQHGPVSLSREGADAAAPGTAVPDGEPGFAGILVAGVLTACIFALVSIPVRLAFAAATRDGVPFRAFSEILIVVVLTVLVRRAAGRRLSGF